MTKLPIPARIGVVVRVTAFIVVNESRDLVGALVVLGQIGGGRQGLVL